MTHISTIFTLKSTDPFNNLDLFALFVPFVGWVETVHVVQTK